MWISITANQKIFQKKVCRMQHRQTKNMKNIAEKLGNLEETRKPNIHLVRVPKGDEKEQYLKK